ncbi:MAG: PepSY-associated TM helix domain-containing protein [Sulfuricurvum sp.]|nr:PepSY-associated TM helix domain-containing protein [Sulfuricurvum sp.]
MIRLSKLHKFGAHSVVFVLLILSISGFFLNHKNWNFLYSTTFTSVPKSVIEHDDSLINGYWIDSANKNHIVIVGKRGVFESDNKGKSFRSRLSIPCNALKVYDGVLYVATHEGIYRQDNLNVWKLLAFHTENINAISVYANRIFASVDQSEVIVMDLEGKVLQRAKPQIKSSELKHDITLARLIRDVHYGRGLFDGIWSLLINDFATIMLSFLLLSGMVMSVLIYQTRKKIANRGKSIRVILKLHATSISVLAGIPLILIALSGILLDHSKLFTPFLKSVNISSVYQPPVYHSLSEDIWSVDYDGKTYRIGNRHGIYQSSDLQEWQFENSGFAYKMIRNDATLYVSGMGAPNRTLENNDWTKLGDSPHMFKDVFMKNGKVSYLKGHKNTLPLPHFQDATLYSVLFTLHDGSFFGDWWAYVNDIAAVILVFLLISGTILWMRIKRILEVK